VLYWNHEDCWRHGCKLGSGPHAGVCRDCRHRQGEICGLTRCALPGDGAGCCHYDVEPTSGPQAVTAEMLMPLSAAAGLDAAGISLLLAELDGAPHTIRDGMVYVDPDRLGVPEVYGVGENDWGEPAGVAARETGGLLDW
jgi:hypothetical protein